MREREREAENYHTRLEIESLWLYTIFSTIIDFIWRWIAFCLTKIETNIQLDKVKFDKQLKPHFKSQRILGDGEGDGRLLSLRYSKQKHHYHNYKSFCTNSFHGSSLSLQLLKVFLIIKWIKETTIYIELLSKYIKFAVLIINWKLIIINQSIN